MKWFKHESRAHRDAKLRKVLMRYGFEGYGLYWYCIENICAGLEPSLTFELEHDSEILAHEGKMDSRKAEEVMRYMVELGLFEASDGVISCLKLARFLGESGTRNSELREIIKGSKSQTVSDNLRLSQNVSLREDKIREYKIREDKKEIGTKRKRFIPPTAEEVSSRCTEMGYTVNPDRFVSHYQANGWKVGRNPMKCWKSALSGWQTRDNETPLSNKAAQPKETASQRMRRELEESQRVIQ